MLSNRTLMTFHDRGEIVEESSSLSIVVVLTVPGCTRSGSLAELTARESRFDSTMWINNVSFGYWTSPGDFKDKRGKVILLHR